MTTKKIPSALTILLLALLLCIGCTKRIYVPAERVTVRTDTLRELRLRVDSVILRDSIAVMQRGDTIYMTKYRDRFRYRERIDTVYQSVGDTVREEVPVPVERELTRWEKVKMDAGGIAIGAGALLLIACAALIIWLVKKKRKR